MRDNILFSHEYDETFYNIVLDGNSSLTFPTTLIFFNLDSAACALRQDLATLPEGDLTEVGEKGKPFTSSSPNCC